MLIVQLEGWQDPTTFLKVPGENSEIRNADKILLSFIISERERKFRTNSKTA